MKKMNREAEIRLQAYLDNEISSSEARQVAAWLARDQAAAQVYEELRNTKLLLSGNEPEIQLPESREFYWSKIEKAIAQSGPPQAIRSVRRLPWWSRLLIPVGAAALLALAGFSLTRYGSTPSQRLGSFNEIETPLDDTSAITFHSQSQGVTVVWLASGND